MTDEQTILLLQAKALEAQAKGLRLQMFLTTFLLAPVSEDGRRWIAMDAAVAAFSQSFVI